MNRQRWQRTRSNNSQRDKPLFLGGNRGGIGIGTLPGGACIFSFRLSAPLSLSTGLKKKGTFRVHACTVELGSSTENTVLHWLRVTFAGIFAATLRPFQPLFPFANVVQEFRTVHLILFSMITALNFFPSPLELYWSVYLHARFFFFFFFW